MECDLLGSFAHGIFQARILNRIAFPTPGDPPDPGIEPAFLTLAGRFFPTGGTWEALHCHETLAKISEKNVLHAEGKKKPNG